MLNRGGSLLFQSKSRLLISQTLRHFSVRLTGIVKFFDKKRGFGYIKEDITGEEHFVHRKAIKGHSRRQENEDDKSKL